VPDKLSTTGGGEKKVPAKEDTDGAPARAAGLGVEVAVDTGGKEVKKGEGGDVYDHQRVARDWGKLFISDEFSLPKRQIKRKRGRE